MESKEAGLPIVFVHGMRVSGTMWRPVIQVIGERHPMAAPDLPGHGDRRGEPFGIPDAVAAVTDAVDELGGRALLVGLSLGGYVALATAGAHPDRVLGLVAMGCTALPRGLFGAAYRGAARLAARHPDEANRLSAFAFRRALPRPQADAMVAGGLSSGITPSIVEAVQGMDPLASLSAYPGPVWLVNGERDHFRCHERRFLHACRDGRLIIRPKCGHLTSLNGATDVARQVLDAAAVITARPHEAMPQGSAR
ncbi:alpha/beta fold hydrolase [Streptomyces sp. ID38640]|uniref:alpha/beta fold hydrolase n=1 Tax=Streptomyces sp. ID38640 TaxID=1265399 RepID=UPI00140F00B1|nr:alpha/beta fold hydrolase [Streptomyces sp. ID38640]QIK10707.1 alpha/beta fold hydrolase [Streptomyces sp. ID38640]